MQVHELAAEKLQLYRLAKPQATLQQLVVAPLSQIRIRKRRLVQWELQTMERARRAIVAAIPTRSLTRSPTPPQRRIELEHEHEHEHEPEMVR